MFPAWRIRKDRRLKILNIRSPRFNYNLTLSRSYCTWLCWRNSAQVHLALGFTHAHYLILKPQAEEDECLFSPSSERSVLEFRDCSCLYFWRAIVCFTITPSSSFWVSLVSWLPVPKMARGLGPAPLASAGRYPTKGREFGGRGLAAGFSEVRDLSCGLLKRLR